MQEQKDILDKLKKEKAESKEVYSLKQCKDTAFHTAAFLEPQDVHNLVRTSKGVLTLYKDALNYKKLLEPLNQVLKANPKKLLSIIPTIRPEYGCMVLRKMNGKQSYYSKKLNQTVTLSEWNNVSPLEAAAHCLDNFIVKELIKFIPDDPKLLKEAITQLQGVLNTRETKKDTHDTLDTEETKTSAERIFLAPYKNLINAYKTFNDQIATQRGLHDTCDKWDQTLLDKLWNEVWEAQRKLPTYGLQEFCDEKPFYPLPSLEESLIKEPIRSCNLDDGSALDLDGLGENLALYKGRVRRVLVRERTRVSPLTIDSAAFDRLCQVRTKELEDIIKLLTIRLQTVPNPKPLCRLTEVKDTAEYVGSFLNAADLANLCRASKDTVLRFSKHLSEMALLKAVFDADPKQVKEILAKPRPPKSKCIVLAKTHIKETYFSQKLNKTGVKREWKNISPLEAAAWCGDIFLVRELLLHVPATQKLDAANQLKGILERKESEENGVFLAPYRALIQAYEDFYVQFHTLYNGRDRDEDKLNKLWHEVWQRQRLLPTYGLQEFCDDKYFNSLSSFIKPPKRCCSLYTHPITHLDLDSLEFGESLYKGNSSGANRGCFAFITYDLETQEDFDDLAAMRRLCEVRTMDIVNIIKEIEGPTLSLESDDLLDDQVATISKKL